MRGRPAREVRDYDIEDESMDIDEPVIGTVVGWTLPLVTQERDSLLWALTEGLSTADHARRRRLARLLVKIETATQKPSYCE